MPEHLKVELSKIMSLAFAKMEELYPDDEDIFDDPYRKKCTLPSSTKDCVPLWNPTPNLNLLAGAC